MVSLLQRYCQRKGIKAFQQGKPKTCPLWLLGNYKQWWLSGWEIGEIRKYVREQNKRLVNG